MISAGHLFSLRFYYFREYGVTRRNNGRWCQRYKKTKKLRGKKTRRGVSKQEETFPGENKEKKKRKRN